MKTLYVSDLDGTLLDSSSKVSERSADLLNRAVASGALFTVATARTPATVSQLMRNVDIRLPMAVMTGVALWNRDTNKYSDLHHFSPQTVRDLLATYRRNNLSSFFFALEEGVLHVYHSGALSPLEENFISERRHSPFKRFDIPPSGESEIPDNVETGLLFFAMQPAGWVGNAYEDLKRVEGGNPLMYYDACEGNIAMIEAFPKGASKANAIHTLAKRTEADRIVAFGDQINDLPLLEMADVAVAVENACHEVKEKADIIIGHHDTDAVASFILQDYLDNHPAAPLLSF